MKAEQTHEKDTDISILNEIKEAEKKAEIIVEKAKEDKETIVHDAVLEASKYFSKKSEEIRNSHEKMISEIKNESKALKESKISEGSAQAAKIKSKSSKKIERAAEFIAEKFEEMI